MPVAETAEAWHTLPAEEVAGAPHRAGARPERRRGGPAARAVRPQRPGRDRRPVAAGDPRRPVQEPHRGPAGRGHRGGLRAGREHRGGRHPGRHRPERGHRLPDRVAGRAGADRPPEAGRADGPRRPRRARSTRSPRPSWCPATSSSSPPGRGCPPTAGSSRARGCRSRRRPLTGESLAGRQGRRPGPRPRARRSATGGTWPSWARRSPTAAAGCSSRPPACGPRSGKIGTLIEEAGDRDTPLERKLAQLGRALVGVVLALCAVIVLAGWLRGHAVPAHAGGRHLAGHRRRARGAARRRHHDAGAGHAAHGPHAGAGPPAARRRDARLDHRHLHRQDRHPDPERDDRPGAPPRASGASRSPARGYATAGEFREGRPRRSPPADAHLALALRIGALCNDATLDRADGRAAVLGDPTEGALLVAAAKAGLEQADLERDYPRVGEVPFSSESKRMVTVHRTPGGPDGRLRQGGAAASCSRPARARSPPDGRPAR